MKREKIQKALIRNILSGSLNATAWAFETLIFMGNLTLEAFLNPSYYADLSSASLLLHENDYHKKTKKKKFKEMTIRHSIWRLQKHGFIEKNGAIYSLTEKGKKLANILSSKKNAIRQKWDGKYRVVIFDIPEKNKDFRNWFRQELYLLNYKKLQKSVFISKLPLTKDLVKEIKKRKMGNYVNYLLVDKVYKNII